MINASAHGWIEKFFFEQNSQKQSSINDFKLFYENTRETGFLVGYTTHFVTEKPIETKGWTTEEFSKIALLNTLFGVYQLVENNRNHTDFIQKCVDFYNDLHPKNSGFLYKILPQDSASHSLEKLSVPVF